MHPFLKKTEVIVDRLIPYALILLLIVIIGEIFFSEAIENLFISVSIIDGIIILIFATDLAFKYMRTRSVPTFFRKYWLEIIAIFPAFLFVRIIEEAALLTSIDEIVLFSQDALEVEQRTATRAQRVRYFHRFARALARTPRFLKAFTFYERP